MTYEEKIDLGVKKFLNGEGILTQIRAILKLSDVRELSKRLEELGYKIYRGAKLSSIIGLKKAKALGLDDATFKLLDSNTIQTLSKDNNK